MKKPRILVVDDDALHRTMLVRVLGGHYEVVEAATAEVALDLILCGARFDVVLSDMCLDGWSGGDLHRRLHRRGDPHASVFVMLSGFDVAERCPRTAATLGGRVLRKPFVPKALLAALADVRDKAAA